MFHPDNDLKLRLARQYTEERLREAAVSKMLKQRNTKERFQVRPVLNQVANFLGQILGSFVRQPERASNPGVRQMTCEECTA